MVVPAIACVHGKLQRLRERQQALDVALDAEISQNRGRRRASRLLESHGSVNSSRGPWGSLST